MKKIAYIKPQIIFFLILLLLPYGFYFFILVYPSIFNPSDSVLTHPFSLIALAGFSTILGSLYLLWKRKSPTENFYKVSVVIIHILLWIAFLPVIFTNDKGIITYLLASVVAYYLYLISKQILHHKAKILLVISFVTIFTIGLYSYKDAYCWRKMLSYEKSHQKEVKYLQSGSTPWQFQFARECKKNFSFLKSLINQ